MSLVVTYGTCAAAGGYHEKPKRLASLFHINQEKQHTVKPVQSVFPTQFTSRTVCDSIYQVHSKGLSFLHTVFEHC